MPPYVWLDNDRMTAPPAGLVKDNTGPEPRIRRVPLDAEGRPARATFNSDSFWGSHWNLNVLWSFAYPRMMSEQVSSLVDYYTNGGMTARGPAGGRDSFVMIGDQATPLVAAACSKGIRDFDIQSARLNGRPLIGRFWITHRELTSGGTLEITPGPEPNKAWGIVPGR
jgi:putative alpha-1,2-mannosidase